MTMPLQVQNAQGGGTPLVPADLDVDAHRLEAKLDGWRLLVLRDDAGVRCWTRRGQEVSDRLPRLAAAMLALPAGTLLDGELVRWRHRDRDPLRARTGTSYDVQRVVNSTSDRVRQLDLDARLRYVAFDLLRVGDVDATGTRLLARRACLEALHDRLGADAPFDLVDALPATQASYDALIRAGWEGAVLKRLDAPYAAGKRGHGWAKLKLTDTVDVEITGWTWAEPGKWEGMIGALTFRELQTGRTGQCSGQIDDDLRRWLTDHRDELVGRVAEIAHMGALDTGGYRHPIFLCLRDDRAVEVA